MKSNEYPNQSRSFFKEYRAVILICVTVVANNIIWNSLDTIIPEWDQAAHLYSSLTYHEILSHISWDTIPALIDTSNVYPPLLYITAHPFYSLFGTSADSAALANSLFLVILILATFGIGKKLYDKETALFSAFAIALFQVNVKLSRDFLTDISMVAMVTLSILAVLHTETFRSRKYSFLAGLAVGIGMLSRINFVFFFLPVFIYSVVCILQEKEHKGRRFKLLLLMCAVSLTVCGPWYFGNVAPIIMDAKRALVGVGAMEGDPSGINLENIFYYTKNLVHQVNFLWWALFVIGLVFFLIDLLKKRLGSKKILLWWFFGSYLIITTMSNKDSIRFSLGYLPVVSLIATSWIIKLSNTKLRTLFLTTIFSLSLLSYFSTSYGFLEIPGLGENTPPKTDEWESNRILSDVLEFGEHYNRSTRVRVIPDHNRMERTAFEYIAKINDHPIEFSRWSNFPNFTDYILTKSGSQGPSFSYKARELNDYIHSGSPAFDNVFSNVQEIPLPDGSTATIFKRDIQPLRNFSADDVISMINKKVDLLLKDYVKNPVNLTLTIKQFDQENTLRGRFKSIQLTADSGIIGDYRHKDLGLPVSNISFQLNDITLNLHRLLQDNKVELLSLIEIIPSGEITVEDLYPYLKKQVKDLEIDEIKLEGGAISALARTKKGGINLQVSISPIFSEKGDLDISVNAIKLGWLSIPTFPINYMIRNMHLYSHNKTPCNVLIKHITVQNGIFVINN